MMKVLKIFGVVLIAAIFLFVVGIFIFIKTFDINRYKPMIIEQASKALKRQVSLEKIELQISWKDGVRARVNNFVINDDPVFSQTPFLKVNEAFFGLDAVSLLKKEIVLSDVDIQSPQISIVRNAQGKFNFQTFGQEPVSSTPEQASEQPASALPPAVEPSLKARVPTDIPFISVEKIQLTNGEITYLDKVVNPAASLKIKGINLELSNVSHNNPFPFSFNAAVFQDQANFNVQGMATLNLLAQSLQFKDLNVSSDIGSIYTSDLQAVVKSFLPQAPAKPVPLPGILKGNVRFSVKELTLSPQGVGTLKIDMDWTQGAITFKDFPLGIPLDISQINLNLRDFSLSDFPFHVSLQMAYLQDAPNLSLEGNVALNLAAQAVSLNNMKVETDFSKLPLEQLKASVLVLKNIPLPQKIEGKLSLVIQELSTGPKGLEKAKWNMSWQDGAIQMRDIVPGTSLEASDIDLTVQGLSLDNEPFKVSLKMAYLNNAQNINFDGTATLNLRDQSLTLKDTQLRLPDLSSFDLLKLKSSLAQLKDAPLPQRLAGQLNVEIKELKAGAQGLKDLLLDAVLTEGSVSLKDIPPGAVINVSKIDFKVKGLSLMNVFPFSFQAAAFDDQSNIFVDGNMSLDLANQMVRLKDTRLKNDLSSISIEALKTALVNLKGISLPEDIRGKIDVNFQDLLVGAKGLEKIVGTAQMIDGNMKLKELAVPVESIKASVAFDGTKVNMEDASFRLGEGTVKASGNIDDFVKNQVFHADISAEKIDLTKILDQTKAPVKVEGIVLGNLSVDGQGLALPGLLDNLSGKGNLEVTEGKIKDINILQIVISKLSLIPNIEERLKAALSEEYKEKLERKDTVLTKVVFPLTINSGKIFASPSTIEADGFMLEGDAQVGFNQAFDLYGQFSMNQELSSAMAAGVSELQFLLSEDQRVLFPFEVHGRLPASLKVAVDLQYLSTRIIKNKGREELNKALDKVFGVEEKPAETPTTKGGTPQTPPPLPEEKPIERQLIEGVLDSIFGQ